MKKLLPIIIALISLSCTAQKGMVLIEGFQEKPEKVIAHVQSKINNHVTLQPYNPKISYVGIDNIGLKTEKQYVFWVVVTGCRECRTKEVKILRADLTSKQVQKDQHKSAAEIREKFNLK